MGALFGVFMFDNLGTGVHNRRCIWGEGQPLDSPIRFFSAAPTPPDGVLHVPHRRWNMNSFLRKMWFDVEGQDIAEYAVMLAVILVIVVGTIRLVGTNANNVFSSVASSVQ